MLCELPYSVSDLEEMIGCEFFEYSEEGLGQIYGLYLAIEDTGLFFRGLSPKDFKSHGVVAYMRSYEQNPQHVLDTLCSTLKVEKHDLPWVTSNDFDDRWMVYRIDDNGNEIEMYQFLNESSAQSIVKSFERKGHKQSYFIKIVQNKSQ